MEEFSSGIRRALAEAAGLVLTPVAEHTACFAAWLNALRDDDYHVSFSSLLMGLRLLGYDDWFEQQCAAALGPPARMLATLFGGRLDAGTLDIALACAAAGHWPDEDWPNAADPGPIEGIPWPRRAQRGELSASAARLLRFAGNRARSRVANTVDVPDLIAAYVLDAHGHEAQLQSAGFDLAALRTAYTVREAGLAAAEAGVSSGAGVSSEAVAAPEPGAAADHPLVRLRADDEVRYVLRHAVNLALGARQHRPSILTLRQLLYALLEAGADDAPVLTARGLRAGLGDAYRPGLGDELAATGTQPDWPPPPFAAGESLPEVYVEVASVLDRAARWAGDEPLELPALALALASEPSDAAARAFVPLKPLTQPGIVRHWLAALHADAVRAGRDPSRYEHWLYGEHRGAPSGVQPDLGRPLALTDDCLDVRRYALALAATAVARETQPPLAIGVFGDWGAGKSHFMGLMELEMRALADGSDARFHRHVLPVWFNAWHYADANLWASLMQTLLEAVDAHVNAGSGRSADATLDADELARLRTALDLAVQFRAEAGAAEGKARQALQAAKDWSEQTGEALQKAREHASGLESTLVDARQRAFGDALHRLATRLRADAGPGDAAPLTALTSGFAAEARRLGLGGLADTAGQIGALAQPAETGLAALRELLADARVQAARTRPAGDWLLAAPLGIRPWQLWLGGGALLGAATGVYWVAARWLPAGGFPTLAALVPLVGGTLVPALAWAKARLAEVRAALDGLDVLRSGLDAGLAQAVEADPAVQAARAALDAARDAQARAEAEAGAAQARVAEAGRAVAASGEALRAQLRSERLGDYLRTRLATDDYRGRLGLVATIRRDLNRLAAFLEPPGWALAIADRSDGAIPDPAAIGHAAPPSARAEEIAAVASLCAAGIPLRSRPLDRIVLYIDDLDRCPPERVVEVLEAVHLLLAIPLFVVVVGVDVRWVSAALCRRYRGLLSGERERSAGGHPTATPNDYLEKIFQIPFRLPAIDAIAAQRLLGTLTGVPLLGTGRLRDPALRSGPESPATPPGSPTGGDAPRPATPVAADRRDAGAVPGAPDMNTDANTGTGTADPGDDRGASAGEPAGPGQGVVGPANDASHARIAVALRFSTAEAACMARLLATLGGSPRRVRRFVNSYRVYKAALRDAELRALTEDGSYREVLAALALQIGLGPHLPRLREALRAPANDPPPAARIPDTTSLDPLHRARLDNALDALHTDGDTPASERQRLLGLLDRPDICRFSFAPALR